MYWFERGFSLVDKLGLGLVIERELKSRKLILIFGFEIQSGFSFFFFCLWLCLE